MLAQVYYFLF